MAYTNTALLGLNLPTTGSESGVWGDDVNNGFTILVDISVAGTNNITYDGDVTLSVSNGYSGSSFPSTSITTTSTSTAISQYYILNLSGARTAARNIIAPALSKSYIITNGTTGGYAITIKKTAGTGVSIAAGETAIVYYNTVTADYAKAVSNVSSIVTPALGGTGVANGTNNTITFTGNYTLGLTLTGNTAVTFPTSGTLLSTAAVVTTAQGGTGVANGANNTITFTGNYTLGLTLSGNTAVTLPTSGTLLTTAGSGSSLTFGTGSLSLAGNLTTSGAFATTVTVTAATAVTLPTTGTLGYQNIPQNSQSAAYTTVAADAGKCIFHPASDANARTFTIDSNANVPYALGTVIQFINMSANNVTIAITSDTLTWAQGGSSGSRTLAQYGVANCTKIGTTQWLLTGTNVT